MKPRIEAKLKSVGPDTESENMLAVLSVDINETNLKTLLDLGYNISNPDCIEFEISIPSNDELNLTNFADFLTSQAHWLIGLNSENIVKRELSRILMEFYKQIDDGRE